jgi:hypothetical protein
MESPLSVENQGRGQDLERQRQAAAEDVMGALRQALVTSTGSSYTGALQRWASTVGAATYSSLLETHAWP